jgi:hypothetical protein
VWIFGCKSRTRQTLGSHQIRVFRHRSEQLVVWEARREHNEALAHILGPKASSKAALTVDKHRPSRLTVAGLRCHSPPIKISLNMFPSLMWSRRSKPYRKPTTVAWENVNHCARPQCVTASTRQRHPWPEPTAPAVGSALGDSCISCEEPMATQHQIGSKHLDRDTD